jgi:hypothetical protein
MPIELNSFPVVPPQRNALTSAQLREYITNPAWSNFTSIEVLVEALETALAAIPVTTRSGTMPDSANLLDRWIDTSSANQEKINVVAYTSGNGMASSWEALTDIGARTIAKTLANAQSPDSGHLSELKTQITTMASDSSLTTDETEVLQTLQAELTARNTEIISSATSYGIDGSGAYTNYITAYSTWLGLPPIPANPLPVNFATVWNDLLDKEATILASIRSASQTLLQTLNGDVTAIQNTVDEIAADNKITPQEKINLKREYDRIKGEYTRLTARATSLGHTGSSEYTIYVATYSTWLTLIDTTLTVFANMATTTTVSDVSAWNLAWNNYYLDMKALDNYVDTNFQATIDGFNSSLTTISNSVSDIAADGIINGGSEKRLLKQAWEDIVTQNTIITAHAGTFGVTVPSAYTTAYNGLDTYLNTTLGVFSAMETDTPVDRAVMEAQFTNHRTQYSLLSQSVATAQATSIGESEPATYSQYTTTVDNIVSDGIISSGAEKQRMNALWADIQATHNTFVAQAVEAGVSTSNLALYYTELDDYLGALTSPTGSTPNFTITTQDSAVGSAAFYQAFRNYQSAKATTTENITKAMLATVRESVQAVADMNNDGVITAIEKTTLKRIWDKYTVERNNAVTQANALSIVTERDSMTTAYTTLESYLNSLDSGAGIFNDMSASTNLTTTEQNNWDLNWFDFETKLQALLTAIQTTQVANNISTSANAFRHDGSIPASGAFNLANFKITNVANGTIVTAGKDAVNGGQLFTEQSTRTTAISDAQVALQANIDAEALARTNAIAAEVVARDQAITDHNNLATGVHGVGAGSVVGTDLTQTLTNKTIDGSQLVDDTVPFSKLNGVLSTLTVDPNAVATAAAIRNYGDTNWGGGGGGGGSVDLEWVTVGDAETANTGTGAIVAEGTLALPAGKTWKWVRVVYNVWTNFDGDTPSIELVNAIDIASVDNTSNFVFSSPAIDLEGGQDSSSGTSVVEGVPSVTDNNILVQLKGDKGANANTKAYIVGMAAGSPSATEEYGVYATGSPADGQTGSSTLLGTRLDITDGDYANSSFNLAIKGVLGAYPSNDLSIKFDGFIKKLSGGDPFVIIHGQGDAAAADSVLSYIGNGTLASGGSTVRADAGFGTSYIEIERVESSNELCFRLNYDFGQSLTSVTYQISLTGPKSYNGTDITSSNGTVF